MTNECALSLLESIMELISIVAETDDKDKRMLLAKIVIEKLSAEKQKKAREE